LLEDGSGPSVAFMERNHPSCLNIFHVLCFLPFAC
jgi:hypothetical protein